MKGRALVFAALLLAACAEKPPQAKLDLKPVRFADLRGWQEDRLSEALPALFRSCAATRPQKTAGAAKACEALEKEPPANDGDARRFFETWFTPYAVRNQKDGLFTGYYEAELHGSWQRGGAYQTPLWQKPADLVTVDLGPFKPELKGQSLAGKVAEQKLVPYDDRAAVARGALAGRAQPLLWTDDPVVAFFLEIQGSGRVKMTDGSVARIGYDAQNGRPYVPVGRVLAEAGALERPVTMAKIRRWLAAHPQQAQETMNRNPSVVFFRLHKDSEGPKGAQGVSLTPLRSLAVDPSFVSLGTPLWLETRTDEGEERRLVIAQDTGGAIKGALRGDLFCGAGAEAEAKAGALQARGVYYVLLPKGEPVP